MQCVSQRHYDRGRLRRADVVITVVLRKLNTTIVGVLAIECELKRLQVFLFDFMTVLVPLTSANPETVRRS